MHGALGFSTVNSVFTQIKNMKHTTKSVSSLSLLALATAATLTSDALAGTPAKPAAPKESGALLEKLNATVEVGYDSAYYFRGLWFSNNNVWEGLTLNLPVNDQLSFSLGAIYTSSTQTNIPTGRLKYSELDLIAGVSYDAGFAKFGLVYTYYNFFDTFSGTQVATGTTYGNNDSDSALKSSQDLGFTVSKSFGPVNAMVGYWYDFRIGGHYIESSADCPIELNSWLSVVPSVSAGYGSDYYSYASVGNAQSGFTTVRPALAFPVKITESATFTPYAAMNLSGAARYSMNPNGLSNADEGRNDFYFGGKMSVSF
jgi:hypothetical protein